jgi:hypothetical protein
MKKLSKAGIPKDRQVYLGLERSNDMSLEDLIDTNLYVSAVNAEIAQSGGPVDIVKIALLPAVGRAAFLARLAQEQNFEIPSKIAIAERLLEIVRSADRPADRHLLDETRRSHVQKLHSAIGFALGIPKALVEVPGKGRSNKSTRKLKSGAVTAASN